MDEDSRVKQKTWQVYRFGKRNVFLVTSEWFQRGFLSERKVKVIRCWWTENRKGAGTNSGESGARNLGAESIRSRAESMGGCIKLNPQSPWLEEEKKRKKEEAPLTNAAILLRAARSPFSVLLRAAMSPFSVLLRAARSTFSFGLPGPRSPSSLGLPGPRSPSSLGLPGPRSPSSLGLPCLRSPSSLGLPGPRSP